MNLHLTSVAMPITKLMFITVVYNNYAVTERYCESLSHQEKLDNVDVHCLIVDNSTNPEVSESVDSLAQRFDFVSILRPNKNIGYFGGLNYAIERIHCAEYENVIICNNDLEFSVDFCRTLVGLNFSTETLAVCPDIVTPDGIHQNPHVISRITAIRRLKLDLFFFHYYVAFLLKIAKYVWSLLHCNTQSRHVAPNSQFIHMGIGACYVLRSDFFVRCKKLEYPYFLYGEEAFFSAQVHAVGGRLFYSSDLRVKHNASATLSMLPSRMTYEYARTGYCKYRNLY